MLIKKHTHSTHHNIFHHTTINSLLYRLLCSSRGVQSTAKYTCFCEFILQANSQRTPQTRQPDRMSGSSRETLSGRRRRNYTPCRLFECVWLTGNLSTCLRRVERYDIYAMLRCRTTHKFNAHSSKPEARAVCTLRTNERTFASNRI